MSELQRGLLRVAAAMGLGVSSFVLLGEGGLGLLFAGWVAVLLFLDSEQGTWLRGWWQRTMDR